LEIYEKSPFYRGFFVPKNKSFFNYFYLPKAGVCSILASPRNNNVHFLLAQEMDERMAPPNEI